MLVLSVKMKLWNGSDEDGNVSTECKDEGTNCKDGDSDTEW